MLEFADLSLPAIHTPALWLYSQCSLLFEAGNKYNTTDQASRLLVGKWIKFSGEVHDNVGNGVVYMMISHRFQLSVLVVLQFGNGWEEQLSKLSRGSRITVRGQIVTVNNLGIHLEQCELL
jgi:hypothetical protein